MYEIKPFLASSTTAPADARCVEMWNFENVLFLFIYSFAILISSTVRFQPRLIVCIPAIIALSYLEGEAIRPPHTPREKYIFHIEPVFVKIPIMIVAQYYITI